MTGNNYQSKAMRTATLKCFDPANAALGLTGEAGEKRGVRLAGRHCHGDGGRCRDADGAA